MLVTISTLSYGQNLIADYNFTNLDTCCAYIPKGTCFTNWSSMPNPDLIHECHEFDNGQGNQSPKSFTGFQNPYSGLGYLHFAYGYIHPNTYHEGAVHHLRDSLIIDSTYCYKLMISPADCTFAVTSSLQIIVSVDSILNRPTGRPKSKNPIYDHPEDDYFLNFNSWRALTGRFIADSAFKHVGFGFFGEDHEYQWKPFKPNTTVPQSSLLMDGVYLLPCSQVDSAEAGTGGFACLEENKSFELGVPNSDGHSWEWWPTIGLDNPNISNPVAHPFETTTYHLKMVNYMHDTLYDSVTIYIDVCQPKFPNIITPNGDLQNDAFVIENLPPGSAVKIFNQWGMEVFSSPNYQNNFDGTSSTGNLSEGVYYYTLEYDFLEERKDTTGYFHLFR